jgi:hypothetical protein
MHHLLAAAGNLPGQTLLLNFEALLAEAEARLVQCTRFLGLETEIEVILRSWPEISTSYSKQPELPYSAFDRNRTLRRGRSTRRADIERGMSWAKSLLGKSGISAGNQISELFFF